jgi:hypothetical protein
MGNEHRSALVFSAALKLHQASMPQCGISRLSKRDHQRRHIVKLFPIVAVVAVLALAPTAFAQSTPTPTNKADCEKAKMKWDAKGGKDGKGACMAATPAKSDAPKK